MRTSFLIVLPGLFGLFILWPQQGASQSLTPEDIANYKKQVTDLVQYLEGTVNFIGDPKSPPREKETVVRETYLKVFKNNKVQVEDDLDENREVALYKDVQAYLKDVDFFFRSAVFKFHIIDITHFTGEDGLHFFKVSMNRDLVAKMVSGDSVKSRKIRYIEVNLDLQMNELKIASIYTTKPNEREAIRIWWNNLDEPWKQYFGATVILFDSIRLAEIAFFEDTLIRVKNITNLIDSDTLAKYGMVVPVESGEQFVRPEPRIIYANTQSIISAVAGILRTTEIDVSGNVNIRSLEPLSELSDLTSLHCSNSLISSIHPVRNLNKLAILDFSNTPVDDLSSLQYSASLREINCSYTLIEDLSPLHRLVGLTRLDISGLRVSRIDFISELPKLEMLALSHTRVSDIDKLSMLTGLEELDISSTPVMTLAPVAELTKLKFLNCDRTAVSSLEPLKGLTNLAGLKISYTKVESLGPMAGLQNLKRIYWESDKLFPEEKEAKRTEAISFMRDNPQTLVIFDPEELVNEWKSWEQTWKDILATTADLSNNPSKEELHALFQIETIELGNTSISTLEPVKQLYNLRSLDVSGTQVTDFKPLADAIALQKLNLSGTTVEHLGFAEKLYKLKELRIENTKVSSLGPIMMLSNVRLVYADHTGITDDIAFPYVEENPLSIVIYKSGELSDWWSQLSGGWKLFFSKALMLDNPPSKEQLHTLLYTESIEIKNNPDVHTLEPVSIFKRLKTLKMASLDVVDLTPLSGLKNLTELECAQMPLTGLNPISSLKMLQSLNLMNTPVSDLRPISGLTEITTLNISGTQVRNLNALSNLSLLETLDLINTRIKTLKPVRGLSGLKSVKCFNTRISQKDVDRFKATNPDCQVIYY
jgi:Leucine-rich repeat (LRR) protein